MSYNHLRVNIRNAYFAEDTDTIFAAWTERMLRGEKEAAGYLRELLVEAMIEIEETELIKK